MKDVYSTINLTKENHLRYWFNGDQSQHRRCHPYEVAHMSIGMNSTATGARFVDSLMETARTLVNRHGNGFRLFLSGGLDSEVACRAFVKAGLQFIPTTIRFTNDLNIEDFRMSTVLCQELGIQQDVIELDPIEFTRSGDWKRIAIDYQCYTFYQQLLISIAEKLSSPMITIDEIEIVKSKDRWNFIKKEDQDGCWHRFVEKTGIPAYNNFYTYDVDTMAGFFDSPTLKRLINNEIPGKLGWSSSKNEIYGELTGFRMSKRHKRHGMERMMHVWDHVQEETAMILHDSPVTFSFEATGLLNQLVSKGSITCNTL